MGLVAKKLFGGLFPEKDPNKASLVTETSLSIEILRVASLDIHHSSE